ncbi:MAG TPA: hypothetical protein VF681_11785 [Abditibacteriaceae bacterium]|jgi:hypothetical protein
MSDYADYRISQARLDRVRERATRQKRMALLGIGVLAVLVLVFALASGFRREKVAPPNVVLTWPSPEKYGKRTFKGVTQKDGSVLVGEVLARSGQPFSIAVASGARWDASFISDTATTNEGETQWKPKGDETLKVFVRPKSEGVRKLVAWAQPKNELVVVARAEKILDTNRRSVKMSGASVWVSQNVATKPDGEGQWDQRAIPLLEKAARSIPADNLGTKRSMAAAQPRWQIVQGFGAKRAADDKASYFSLQSAPAPAEDAAITMTEIARFIAERASQASIKWIVANAGSADATAILRLEFDGSGARGGWVKRAGETEATPLRWWNRELGEEDIRERLEPSLPR